MAPYYAHWGRPSVVPELMIRMSLVAYVDGGRLAGSGIASGDNSLRPATPRSLNLWFGFVQGLQLRNLSVVAGSRNQIYQRN